MAEKLDIYPFLNLRRLPARVDAVQAAILLGVQIHDIPILARGKVITPLGEPAKNSQKFFATCELEKLKNDVERMGKLQRVLQRHWLKKNRTNEQSRWEGN